MHISYKPLWHTLLERDMRKEDLRLAAGMTTNMIANMSKEGKHISMDAQPLLPCEVADYELRPSRHNPDIRREMDAQAQIVGTWEDAKRVPEQKRLTWFYPDFGSYVPKEHITPEQLAAAARGVERQRASRAYKEGKRPISQQMQDAAKQAEADRGQSAPKKNAPDRGDR